MAFQDEDEVGGKMRDESFLEKVINQKIRLVAGLYNEIDDRKKAIKMLAERHAKLEAENAGLKKQLNFFDEYFSDETAEGFAMFALEKENAELRDALTMIAAKVLDLMGEKR